MQSCSVPICYASPSVLELSDRLVDLVYLFLAPAGTCVT